MKRSLISLFLFTALSAWPADLGLFEDQTEIGILLHPGSANFDAAHSRYSITASGENMWATADAFHFVWKKFSGDAAITADIAFPTTTGNPHKKAVLMVRQSLDAGSAYVDAALHVEGLTSLQWRGEQGGATHEVGVASAAATRLRLVKRGTQFYMYWARQGEELHLGGGSIRLEFKEPFYIGLGVSAHDKDAIETAVFSNVTIDAPVPGKPKLHTTLETISISSTDRRVVKVLDKRAEILRWSDDGTALLFKEGRKIKSIPATGGAIATAAAGNAPATKDARSPDGKSLAVWSYDTEGGYTTLLVKTLIDGKSKVLAKLYEGPKPKYAPAWSPDSKRLAFASYQLVQ